MVLISYILLIMKKKLIIFYFIIVGVLVGVMLIGLDKKPNNNFSYSGSSNKSGSGNKSSGGSGSKSISIPLKSSVKISDPFHVSVVDSSNNVICEREYVPNKYENLSVEVNKNTQYTVLVKNNKTNKTAKYGVFKMFVDEDGVYRTKSSFNPGAFIRTLED